MGATGRILAIWLSAVVLMAAGCDRAPSRSSRKAIELRFWNGFTGPDGMTMLGIVKKFNEENPDVHVTMQRMEWGTYYNKLFVAGLGGRAPEVFVIHTDTLARFTRAKFVQPVDSFAKPGGMIDTDDIDANVWAAAEYDGKHYAVPLDIHLLGMYYNKTLFKEAGIEHPPTNRAEFLDALKKIRDLKQPHTWGFGFGWQRTNLFTFCRQNGGRLFTDDFSAPLLTDPKNVQALAFAVDLIEQQLVPGPQAMESSWLGFRQGKIGMIFEGIYNLPDLQKQTDLDYGTAPLPTLFDHPAAWANSHNLCLRADLKGDDLAASRRFIKYLSDHSLDWAEGGQIPVRKSLRSSERFAHMDAQRAFARQIPYACYMPRVPFVFEYQTQFEAAIESALRGTQAPAEAMQIASDNIQKVIDRYKAADALATAGTNR